MQTKIPSYNLIAGMYVAELDRPWMGTPFLLQGFLIESDEHLMQLRQYCKFVLVDTKSSTSQAQDAISKLSIDTEIIIPGHTNDIEGSFADDASDLKIQASFIPDSITLTPFRNIVPMDAELAPAGSAYSRTADVLNHLFKDLTSNNILDLQDVDAVVSDMVESMVRNPDALMMISNLQHEDETAYGHAINVAIYLVALGRHLSLPKEMLEHLCMLGLLHDIGESRLPHELLHKEGRLTSVEFETIKNHIPICLEMLKALPNMHPDVLEGVAQHHERENGSGYPAGLSKGQIGLFGRMVAIADSFAAMSNQRPYSKLISAYEALQVIVNFGHGLYHPPIVEQFIRAIGIFPVGSMVELSTGEVAIVITHSKVRRLKPRVLVISNKDKASLESPYTLDLMRPTAIYEEPPSILKGLPTGAFGLDSREYYLS